MKRTSINERMSEMLKRKEHEVKRPHLEMKEEAVIKPNGAKLKQITFGKEEPIPSELSYEDFSISSCLENGIELKPVTDTYFKMTPFESERKVNEMLENVEYLDAVERVKKQREEEEKTSKEKEVSKEEVVTE